MNIKNFLGTASFYKKTPVAVSLVKNKESYFLFFEEKKRKFVRINLLMEICFVRVFFETKNIFSYTFDLCGRVGDKKIFIRPISGNKTTFFDLRLSVNVFREFLKKEGLCFSGEKIWDNLLLNI